MVLKKKTFIMLLILAAGILFGSAIHTLWAYRIVAVLILAGCIGLGIQERKLLNPYFLFAITPLTLLCYTNISDFYMSDLTPDVWRLAVLNMGGFLLALSVFKGYRKKASDQKYNFTGNRLYIAIAILALVGFLPQILLTFFHFAIPLYSVFSLFGLVALACAIQTKKPIIILAVMALNLVTWLEDVTKTAVLSTCMCVMVVYEHYFVRKRRQKIRILLLGAVGVAIMFFAFTFANQSRDAVSSQLTMEYYRTYGGVKWDYNPALFMPYMYLETPWTNLHYLMDTLSFHTYGLWALKPILNYLQLDSLLSSFYSLNARSSFNTFTYIACQYRDFGMYGSVILSVFLGCFVKWVYSRARITNNPLDVACYAYTAQAVLQMFFSNHFFQQSYPFTVVLIVALFKFLYSKVTFSRNPIPSPPQQETL